MKVVVQRPLEDPSGSSLRFSDRVFEVAFRGAAPTGDGWAVIESISAVDDAIDPAMPYLHKGFFDAHLHMTWMGLYSQGVDLSECRTIDELKKKVQSRLASHPSLVQGYGWEESKFGLSLEALAAALREQLPESAPIILYRVCAHSAFVNRQLLKTVGLPPASVLVTDKLLSKIRKDLPQPSQSECEVAILRAQESLIALGVSAVGDMSLDETMVAALRALAEQGSLKVDIAGVVDGGNAPSVENSGPFLLENSVALGPLDRPAQLSVRHWKRFLDGSLGSRTAWLSQPYNDLESFGDSLCETEALLQASRQALMDGFHLSFHAIGDAALDQVIEVGERLGRLMDSRRRGTTSLALPRTRHRIEHGQIARDDQILRLRNQSHWVLCAQPHHRVADSAFIEKRIGKSRLGTLGYRAKSFLENGVPLALSSDGPIDTTVPREVLRAVTSPENGRETLELNEALWAYTSGARLQLGLHPGRLGPGATAYLSQGFGIP